MDNGTSIAPHGASIVASPPPHPLDTEWFMHIDGTQYGPYSGHRLKEFIQEGRLHRDSSVIRSGAESWRRADEDPFLAVLFSPIPPAIQHGAPGYSPFGQVAAGQGATVVQVTNQITPPTPVAPQTIYVEGEAKNKSPAVALVLSILCVGLGQIYNGQVGKGILMFIAAVIGWLALLGWVIMIWSWVDAYSNAKQMRERYQRRLASGIVV